MMIARRLERDRNDADALSLLAEMRAAAGRNDSAVEVLTHLIALRPNDPASRRRLGGVLLALGRAEEAVDAFDMAIRIEPDNARAHNNLGKALLVIGRRAEAIASLEEALRLDPRYDIAASNLGMAYSADGHPARALDWYERALATTPNLVQAWVGRGAALAELQRFDLALASFGKALQLTPQDPLILTQRAAVLLLMERAQESLSASDHALQVDANLAAAHNVRAGALRRLGRRADAVTALRRAVALAPQDAEAWSNLGTILHELGEFEEAVSACRRAVDSDPGSIQARTRLLARLIPSVPRSAEDVVVSRRAFDTELTGLTQWLGNRALSADDTLLVAQQQFFYLSYEEVSNRALLQHYRSAGAARLLNLGDLNLSDVLAPCTRPAAPCGIGRVKLGFVSAHVHDHSVFHAILRGWLECLDHGRFELTLFNLGLRHDACTDAAVAACDRVESGPRRVADWARCIRDCELDAVIFPEIGMHEATLALAGLRLARHQFAAWGHPETSGLPTIDGYLSAELFEPPEAEVHYAERLIKLPNMGVYCRPYTVEPTAVDLAKLEVDREGPLLICPGVPFKYRPQHDGILVEIARRLGRCTFVFFDHEIPELSRKLEARLAGAFTQGELDPQRYLKWIPWQPRASFFGLLGRADVFLDTIGFSGFNTMMQAVQCHLPCVTYAGRFMRGRLGSGILERMGISELIARDADEYIELALRLATDANYRESIRVAMSLAEHRLYEDTTAIDALSELLSGLHA